MAIIPEAEQSAIDKLKKAGAKGCTFTGDEVKALKRVVKIVQAFDILGGLGHFIKNVLMWIAFMIGAWLAFKNGIAGWVKSL